RGADEHTVVGCSLARARRRKEHPEIGARLALADELVESLRAQRRFRRVLLAALRRYQLSCGTAGHRSGPRLYLLGRSSPIGTTVAEVRFGTITRASGS